MECNQMKMREALVIAKKAICHHASANHTCDSLAWESDTANANCGDILCAHRDLCEAKTAIQKALAEPPRQCDVGTPDEQERRFCVFCLSQGEDCTKCQIHGEGECRMVWAQMPYEAQEGAGE